MAATVKEGLFFFDDEWNDVDKIVTKEKIKLHPELDEAKNYYLLAKNQIELEPGEYNFAIEFQEERTKNTGAYREKIKIDSYPFGKLNISDILLASKIDRAEEDSKYTKNGLRIIPNAARIFQRDQLMYVYFEIYDLIVNAEQKTNFIVEYTVSSKSDKDVPAIKRIFTGLGKFLGVKTDKNEITASFEYDGTMPTDNINLSIDLSAAKTGLYDLTIKVKDLNGGDDISKKILFAVQKDMVNYLF